TRLSVVARRPWAATVTVTRARTVRWSASSRRACARSVNLTTCQACAGRLKRRDPSEMRTRLVRVPIETRNDLSVAALIRPCTRPPARRRTASVTPVSRIHCTCGLGVAAGRWPDEAELPAVRDALAPAGGPLDPASAPAVPDP